MRTAFFTECYHPIVNGIVASIDGLRDGLRANGVDVTTIAPRFPRFVDDVSEIVRIPSLPLPTSTAYRLCLPYLSADDRRHLRGVDVVHAHSAFVTGWMGAAYARRRGIPFVFTYHTRLDAYAHYAPFERAATERAMARLTRSVANAADAVVAPTQSVADGLRALGVVAPISVVPSGIDVAAFARGRRSAAVREELGAAGGAPLALVVGRLGAEKNVELALEAIAHRPEACLAIVGDGPQRAALEARAAALGIAGRVRFTGEIPRDRLPEIYAAADVLLFPSRSETQGLVLVEALAAGLPIVAADSEVSREVLGDGAGIVPADPAAIAVALGAGFASGRDQSAVRLAFTRYTVELHARRIVALYREVVAARAA